MHLPQNKITAPVIWGFTDCDFDYIVMMNCAAFCRTDDCVFASTEEDAEAHMVQLKATKLLRSEFDFSSITIQVERHSTSAGR